MGKILTPTLRPLGIQSLPKHAIWHKKTRLRPIPVLGIGIGPIPSVSPIPEPIPVGHDTFVTTANAVC